jgi:1-deoxy-D-xylulose-5-phosphate synthase
VVTQKGKGHPDADTDPYGLHKHTGPTLPVEAKLEPEGKERPIASKSYTRAFVDALTDLSEEDPKIVAITAAMPDGTGLVEYAEKFPDRVYDVGISEQCAVAFAAGLAHSGLRPVCAIYSSFSQRAYDIVFQEMCLNNLPVTLVLDRAGIAGEDGPTHHGNFDISALRTFPNMTLMAPKDEKDLREMLKLATRAEGPVAIRLPREKTPILTDIPQNPVVIGKGEILREGKDGAILGYGVTVARALEAADMLAKEGVHVTVANARFAKPLDASLASKLIQSHPWVLTVEDHASQGGFGSAVLEELALRNEDTRKIHIHAIPDRFLQHADREELVHYLHLDGEGIADVCRMILAGEPAPEPNPEQRKHFFYEG